MNEKLHKKISPPFEGEVVGTIDYHIFTDFYFPTGVVDPLISSYLYWCERPEVVINEIRKTYKRKDPEFE